MNLDFSDDVTTMREEVRRALIERVPVGAVRALAERGEPFDRALWREMGTLGWLGIAVPEAFGGAGMGYEPLCMLAEEIGRVVAPVPFSASVYLATEAVALFGSDEQKARWLPDLASGAKIGAFALAEGAGQPKAAAIRTTCVDGVLNGRKIPVWEGGVADILIVAARREDGTTGLYVVEAADTTRSPLPTIELGDAAVTVVLAGAKGDPLPLATDWPAIERLLERAAILFAFEAVGGAQAALDMAVDYAKQRYAFGRPIASMQAIKHQLADVYVAIELARSNAYFGAWALEREAPELSLAAASARLGASEAYEKAAAQSIQTHGGMGFTQEVDCHLHYRRAKRLSVEIGGARYWRDRLIAHLPATTAA